jgi:hypothetical protein
VRVAILLNRDAPRLRTLGKQALATAYELARGRTLGDGIAPEFDAFARLLDDDPLVLGTSSPVDWAALARAELLLWEWGWTATPAGRVLEIRRRVDVPTIVFPGPLDRFWREVDVRDVPTHLAALAATDAVGVMLRDTASVYAALAPAAHVFHMPVPVDVARFAARAAADDDRDDVVLLTAPTRFCGPASQLPITAFLAFRALAAERPTLEGLAFCYGDDEAHQAALVLRELGLADRVRVRQYVRPLGRWVDLVRRCRLALALPHAVIQGRTALMTACLRIPTVTSSEIETHRTLWPRTVVAWHDVAGAVAASRRLLDEPALARGVADEAQAAVAYYDVARARARLAGAVEHVRARRPSRAEARA